MEDVPYGTALRFGDSICSVRNISEDGTVGTADFAGSSGFISRGGGSGEDFVDRGFVGSCEHRGAMGFRSTLGS